MIGESYVIGFAKTGHNHTFFQFYLINFCNLLSQVYAKMVGFQSHMLRSFGVTVLQNSNKRKIDLYSKCREIKNYRCLLKRL